MSCGAATWCKLKPVGYAETRRVTVSPPQTQDSNECQSSGGTILLLLLLFAFEECPALEVLLLLLRFGV